MKDVLTSISVGISGLSGSALAFFGALAIAGTLAMAILQVIKELTPVRRSYQRRWLARWFQARASRFMDDWREPNSNVDRSASSWTLGSAAQSSLVDLATGGEANAFYDLAIEQMVAQMNAAAQVALENPTIHFSLLAVLSQGADVEDVRRLLAHTPGQTRDPDQTTLGARNRVGHRIQRNLDGIQIALGSRWKLWMQTISIVFTVLFVELAIIANVDNYQWTTLLVGVVLGIVGGYLAPVTRDLVAALQSLRKG